MGDGLQTSASTDIAWLRGSSELGALIRARDWSQTSLGPITEWPGELRTAVSLLLPSRAQIALFWGPDLVLIYNDPYRPVLGDKHPWALGQPARECWREVWPVLEPLFTGVLRSGEAFWAQDHPFLLERHGFPEETYFDVSYDPVSDATGKVDGVFCIVSETTGRVLGERRLRTLRELGGATFESAHDACRHAAAALGQNSADLPFALLYLLDESERRATLVATAGVPREHLEPVATIDLTSATPAALLFRKGDSAETSLDAFGIEAPANASPERALVLPLSSSGQPAGFLVAGTSRHLALSGSYRDFFDLVADRISAAIAGAHAYEQQRQRAEALAELDRAKTAFFSNISHEFRTPLTLMLGPLEQTLAAQTDALDPGQREELEVVHRNGLRLLRLVNALLDFSRIEAGRVEAAFEPTDLAVVTAELASVFRSAIEKAGLRFHVECLPLPSPVYVDRDMWEKVLFNLLSNAFKFTFVGEIAVATHWLDDHVELIVRDTGSGIAPHDLPHIFERFQRIRGAKARTQEGAGIGLALVQELVRLHGGTISVESEPDRGTVFTVSIPTGTRHLPADRLRATRRAPANLEAAIASETSWIPLAPGFDGVVSEGSTARTLNGRIVLADDNADMRAYVSRLLGRHWEVSAVADGTEALALARSLKPDLVLADVMMPGLDGFDLLRALRADQATREIPVILLTARAGEESRAEGLATGADDYLVKPFSARELEARVDAHVRLRRLREQTYREQRAIAEQERRSRVRYRRIFENAGVSLWEEDLTAVKAAIDELRSSGVHDIREYMANHPEFVEHCIGLVRIVDVNQASLRLFDAANKNELVQALPKILDGVEPRACFAHEIIAIAEEHSTFEGECAATTLQGRHCHVLVNINLPGPDESFESVLVSVTDITLRKRAEDALRDSETQFHEMADTAPAKLWIADAAGSCTFLSRRWYEFTGQTPESGRGFGWLAALHPDDQGATERKFLEAFAVRQPFHLEYRVKRAEGDYRWVINAARPRWTHDHQFLGFVGAVVDITERKVAGDALKEEVRLRETLASVGAALAAELDPDRLVQGVTDAGTILTTAEFGAFFYNVVDESGESYKPYTLSGVAREAFAHFPNPRVTELLAPTFRGEAAVRIDDVTKDPRFGRNAPYHGLPPGHLPVRSYLAVPVVSNSGEVLGGLFFGHSRPGVFLAKHEQLASGIAFWAAIALDNARLHRDVQNANRMKDEFLATLSHELRTPLNAILGWSELLRTGALPEEMHTRALESIERSAHAQAQLVEDLLDISRIVSGRLKMSTEEVNLGGVIVGALDAIRPAAAARSVELSFNADADVQVLVTGDADRLQQIVWNLLSNAVKFTAANGQVEVTMHASGSSVEVKVRDTGVGIEAAFLPHIFERFQQADRSLSRKHGGLGLGLAIVRQLTEAHGGSVWADSPGIGLGASFTVQLPVRDVRKAVARTGKRVESSRLGGLHLLVVDDDADARCMIQILLESNGARVTAAASAGEALHVLAREHVDLLLADIGMPGQDGYALIRAVRVLKSPASRIPAIAVTAYTGPRERERTLQAGYGWHVGKPVNHEHLVALVSEVAKKYSLAVHAEA